jgi:hypothetical protein
MHHGSRGLQYPEIESAKRPCAIYIALRRYDTASGLIRSRAVHASGMATAV